MVNEKLEAEKIAAQKKLDGSPPFVGTKHFEIKFQLGPVKEFGENGCQIDDVIAVLIKRIEGFQAGPYKCRENALAITKLEEAVHWLKHRTAGREARGVEGTNQP